MTNPLDALSTPDTATLDRLRGRLISSAAEDGTLDVAYRTMDTSIGELLVAATPIGLVRIAFENEGIDPVLAELADRLSPRVLAAPRRLDAAAREIDGFLAGQRRSFDLPLDLSLSHGFRRTVLEHLCTISYGSTESYAVVARAAGSPRAVRAVGSACATNPLPLVIPCHRVVRSDGTYGAYRGGPETKRALLTMESAA